MYRKDLCALCTLFDLKCCNKRMLPYCDETLRKSMSQSVLQTMLFCVSIAFRTPATSFDACIYRSQTKSLKRFHRVLIEKVAIGCADG